MAAYRPGNEISVVVNRKNKEQTLKVKLKNTNGNTNIVKGVSVADLGVELVPLSTQMKRQLNYNGGLLVQDVKKSGLFAKAGIEKGFIVLKINNKTVSSTDDLSSIYSEAINNEDTDKVLFVTGIARDNTIKHYVVNLK